MNVPAGLSTEMCDMVIQTLKQVTSRELPDEFILELDENDEFPMEVIKRMLSPDVGLHLIFLPENVGGLGGGARDICRVSEEMAKVDLGVATAFLAICLGTDPILVGGTEEQKAKWLTRIAGEGLIVAYGVTEPAAGSNVASIQTTADQILDADGNITGYRLNGTKQFITNGGVAQLYTILARTPGGPSFFVVERDTPGLSVGKHEDKHGIRASNTTGVIMEDVEVPRENLIGIEEGQGLKQANAVFGYTRLMVGAFGLGGGQGALDRALDYALTREQFGGPIYDKQGYRLKLLIESWIDLEAGRAYAEQTALTIDAGNPDLATEGSIAKYWCTEAGQKAANNAIQALGGYGYTREYVVEKMYRDVRITTIYEGTSEIQQSIIGMFRWKETARSKGAFYEEMARGLDEVHTATAGVGADLAAGAVRGVNEVVLALHKARQTRNQVVMFAMADMMTIAEIAAALVTKAGRLATEGDSRAEHFAAMSRAFARKAQGEVLSGARRTLLGFTDGSDEEAVGAAREVLGKLEDSMPLQAQAGLWTDMEMVSETLRTLHR